MEINIDDLHGLWLGLDGDTQFAVYIREYNSTTNRGLSSFTVINKMQPLEIKYAWEAIPEFVVNNEGTCDITLSRKQEIGDIENYGEFKIWQYSVNEYMTIEFGNGERVELKKR